MSNSFLYYLYSYNCPQKTFNARESLVGKDQSIRVRYSLWHSPQQRFKPGAIAASPQFYSGNLTTEQQATSSGIPELGTVDQLRPNEPLEPPQVCIGDCRFICPPADMLTKSHAAWAQALQDGHNVCGCNSRLLDDLDLSRIGRHHRHEEYLHDNHMPLPLSLRVQFLIN